jgi:hypothetical protein
MVMGSSREKTSAPSGMSLANSSVATTSPVAARFTATWLSTAPVSEVWPRGRLASMPQHKTHLTIFESLAGFPRCSLAPKGS